MSSSPRVQISQHDDDGESGITHATLDRPEHTKRKAEYMANSPQVGMMLTAHQTHNTPSMGATMGLSALSSAASMSPLYPMLLNAVPTVPGGAHASPSPDPMVKVELTQDSDYFFNLSQSEGLADFYPDSYGDSLLA